MLEDRCVPATTLYDATLHLPVSNTLLIDQQLVFDSASYDPTAGPLSVQITNQPTMGSASIFNGFDFTYTPGNDAFGTDRFFFDILQGADVLLSNQEVVFDLGPQQGPPNGGGGIFPGTNGNQTPVAETGNGQVDITFLPYTLDSNNSEKSLFLADGNGDLVLPVICLSVQVDGSYGGNSPTGKVTFRYSSPTGPLAVLGSAQIGSDGKATIKVDSGLLDDPGVVVSVHYSGDQFFADKDKDDAGQVGVTLANLSVTVTDNPVIAANATNLTVVVVCGANAAQAAAWRDSARTHYGTNAFLITNAHSVTELGTRLAALPAGSISRLELGGHGFAGATQLGLPGVDASRFHSANLTSNPNATAQIRNALSTNARLTMQSCNAMVDEDGEVGCQQIATILEVEVCGADDFIGAWDDPNVGWWIVSPQVAP